MDAATSPLGAHWDRTTASWRFAVWAPDATSVLLECSTREDPATPVVAEPMTRDGDVWRVEVARSRLVASGADSDERGLVYGYRADGPWAPEAGRRFDPSKVLLDPYARTVHVPPGDHVAARGRARERGSDTAATAPRAVLPLANGVAARASWMPPTGAAQAGPGRRTPVAIGTEVIYEAHVRGFTMADGSVAETRRGTFAGLIGRLDHLRDLGVTVIELLPVNAADPGEGSYWGYMPLAWLAVEDRYAAGGDGAAELSELCAAAADRGIEIWLDVVYNHTTEEDDAGPTYSLRGLADGDYYVIRDGAYVDDAGTGNILRAAHPVASDLVLASLDRLAGLGVGGFRFDLASIVGRDIDGTVQARSDLCDRISAWAATRGVRLVAEAWDVASYQVGDAFPGRDWAQWNDRFRNDVRGFLRGEEGLVPALVQRVQGSPDLFPGEPTRSVNFVTAHDGFTLYDLVSYDRKHNAANGWNGADGSDDNRSWNCGVEGDVGLTAEIRDLRARQMRNAFVVLLMSAGVPMFVAGDEFARTQGGNNNAYNQDNATSWVDWGRLDEWADLRRFVSRLIGVRRAAGVFGRPEPWGADVSFFGAAGPLDPGPWSRSLGWHLHPPAAAEWAVIANAWWEPLDFALPGDGWRRVVDTALAAPADIVEVGQEVPVPAATYRLGPRSCVVLTRLPAADRDLG